MRRGLLTTTCSAIAIVAGMAASHLEAASTLVVSSDEIRVIVPIEIDGASDQLTGAWMGEIDAAWNRGNNGQSFQYCGRPVKFVPILKLLPASGVADIGYHLLMVQPVPAGQRFVSNVTHTRGTRPTESNRNGFIDSTSAPQTVAHEFGHYLGLDDEYYVHDANANGQRDASEFTSPSTFRHSDAATSLMATLSGHVLQRHIDAALVEHGIDAQLTCPTEILIRGIYTTQPVGGCNGDRATIEARITAPVSRAGVVGQGPLSVTWRALNRCPSTLFGGYRAIAGATSTFAINARDELTVGHAVTTSSDAQHESLFISGERIGTGNFLKQWPAVVNGSNVTGTLASFVVPHGEWHTGAIFRFENRGGTLGPKGDMRLSGSATVEVCPTSSAGPFKGCTTAR